MKEGFAAGLAAFKKGDLDAADAAFRSTAQLAPTNPMPLLGLAEIADRRGDKATAEANLKKGA